MNRVPSHSSYPSAWHPGPGSANAHQERRLPPSRTQSTWDDADTISETHSQYYHNHRHHHEPHPSLSPVGTSKSVRYRYIDEGDGGLLVLPAEPPKTKCHRDMTIQCWPLPHLKSLELEHEQAQELIANGAPSFRGKCKEVSYEQGHFHFYAMAGNELDEETDCVPFESESFNDMSNASRPMDSLERPFMQYHFGIYPGTITLGGFAASFGSPLNGGPPLTGDQVKLRKLNMVYVVERLRRLKEVGIDEYDRSKLYHELYANLLYDGITYENDPHRFEMGRQIHDLIDVLARREWVDFSDVENQIVPDFFFRDDNAGNNRFFQQLLLSIELFLRINSRGPLNHTAKPKLSLPVKVRYDLVLAQRWLENVEIERPKASRSGTQSLVTFRFQNKAHQVETLRNFGWTLKWPNMPEVEFILSEVDKKEKALEDRSVNCMSWFTGLILPGRTMPWILMKTLIDCDPDAPEALGGLSHMMPNSGLQWRGATYWSWECILGKVLGAAKGVKQMCGWLGPLPTSPELHRTEVVLVNQMDPPGHMTPSDVQNMEGNSEAISEFEDYVHADDYDLILPDFEDPTDTIRLERLNFQPSAAKLRTTMKLLPPASQKASRPASGISQRSQSGRSISGRSISASSIAEASATPPVLYDASITFAISSRSWRVYLRYDASFIAAYPCRNGPHVLCNVYNFRTVRPDKLMEIKYWGSTTSSGANNHSNVDNTSDDSNDIFYNNEVEEVLVIEAYGVHDNAVFSRAWCSYWGLAAVVGDVERSCTACCVREAYAAGTKVVILTCERLNQDNEVEEVDRTLLEV